MTTQKPRIRAKLASALRKFRLERSIRRLLALPPGQRPNRDLLAKLRNAWGNEGFSADVAYLDELCAQAAATPGPVLECGSGLTTVLLGGLAGRRGIEVWSLEHSPEWHARVSTVLKRHTIPGVRLCLAPIRDYGAYSWYEPPLADMPRDFRLVVCDGPPDSTPGGRYGLMPVLGDHLAPDVLILLDDATRKNEAAALRRWESEAGMTTSIHRRTTPGSFARVTRKAAESRTQSR